MYGVEGGDVLARIEKSIEIKAPAKKVWQLLFWDRIPEWMDILERAEYTSEKRAGVGATAHVIGEAAGVKAEWDVEVTEYVENEKAIWRSTAGNVTALGTTTLKPTKAGTEITLVMDYELPYSILGKIINKLMVGKEMEKDFERALEKLKNILEK